MKFNVFHLLMLGGAIAAAVNAENAPGADKKGRRERAVRLAVNALAPVLPGVSEDPANAEDMGVIIDKFVAIQNRVKAVQDAKKPHPPAATNPLA